MKPLESNHPRVSSIVAEEAIIGILAMVGREALAEIDGRLSAFDFTNWAYRDLFSMVVEFDRKEINYDLVALMTQARAGNPSSATEAGHAAANYTGRNHLNQYVKMLLEATARRDLQAAAMKIYDSATSDGEITELIDSAQALTANLGGESRETGLVAISAGVGDWLDGLDKRVRSGGGLSGISTGYRDLDRKIGGLEPGQLVVIAGRPSMGKTSLALSVAMNVARDKRELPVCVFSIEMGYQEILSRAISNTSGVGLLQLRTGDITDEDWNAVNRSLEQMPSISHFLIDESADIQVAKMRSRARRVKAKSKGLAMIVVDYIQLMSGDGEADNRASQIAGITRGLKAMAREMACPVIVISQLNREVEKRQDKRPMMADLKESGAIEQDADLILFVYRDVVYNQTAYFPHAAEVIIAKQRNGPTGTVLMDFKEETATFRMMDSGSQQLYWDELRNNQGGRRRGYD